MPVTMHTYDFENLITADGKRISLTPISFETSVDTVATMEVEVNSIEETTMRVIPEVKKIIFHDPATIVFWKDGTKTVVKCMEGTPFNPYYGYLCAVGKKLYGNNSAINRIIKEKGNA